MIDLLLTKLAEKYSEGFIKDVLAGDPAFIYEAPQRSVGGAAWRRLRSDSMIEVAVSRTHVAQNQKDEKDGEEEDSPREEQPKSSSREHVGPRPS